MRNPTEAELKLLQTDLDALKKYCSDKKLITNKFKRQFNKVGVLIADFDGKQSIGGKTDYKNKKVIIRSDKMPDDIKRRHALYHETGHFLFGFSNFTEYEKRQVLKKIVKTRKNNKQLLSENTHLYLSGIRLLEEHIVEKFAISASHETLNQAIEATQYVAPSFCGNYTFTTTFNSAYGVCESLCNNFLGKTYNSFDNILLDCLDSSFYKDLFEKYDNIALMQILAKFGHIYNSIITSTKTYENHSPIQMQEILESLPQMISQIKIKSSYERS